MAFIVACLAAGAAHAASPPVVTPPVVTDVRVGAHVGSLTRLVFDVTQSVEPNVFTLTNPDRVVLDLPDVAWQLKEKTLPTSIGLLARMRYGLFKPGTWRVVLDMKAAVAVERVFVLPPRGGHAYRLVVDIKPAALVAPDKRVRPKVEPAAAPAAPVPAQPIRKPKVLKAKPTIVIDAGHGGVDPGTIGRGGEYEKNITLAMARALADHLRARKRYIVKLTRDRDIFLPLRERVAIARRDGGDLFISLHANTINNPHIRGLSVFTLSEKASDKEAAQLAEKENKADLIAGMDLSAESPEVTNILIDLAQRESMNQSAKFATDLVRSLHAESPLLRRTHRFAGFAVLKAPDIPSVLVELGFLSNRQDEHNLLSARYRARLAEGMARGVDAYFVKVQEAQQR